jgi:uncharacterized protein with GYD domain
MPKHVVLINWGDRFVAKLDANKPAAALEKTVKARVKDAGGRLQSVLWTLGAYDAVLTVELESIDVGALAVELTREHGVRTTTLTAFSTGEMDDVIAKGKRGP